MTASTEIDSGERFAFGANWSRFVGGIDDAAIDRATGALREMLDQPSLAGRSFLDVGSGSGLSSLAARRLGAAVHSFDYDPASVACTRALRARFAPDDPHWRVEEGSALDEQYLERLGKFDIVYLWGVLHHTGRMHEALDAVARRVAPGGRLFVAIYNDQGAISRYWLGVKRRYNRGALGRAAMVALHVPYLVLLRGLVRFARRRPQLERGMSLWTDTLDWLGGYPFEVARPEEIVRFHRERGFRLENLRTCGGRMGCNEFVFLRG